MIARFFWKYEGELGGTMDTPRLPMRARVGSINEPTETPKAQLSEP